MLFIKKKYIILLSSEVIAIDILDRIQKSLNYIEENIYEDIKIEEVVEEAFMSVSLFYKLFSKVVGTTLKDYIRKRRLSLSKKDLIETKQSILEIALKYQYETYEAYSRSFKKLFGVSPKRYRESVKNVNEYTIFQKISLICGGVNMNEERIKEKINASSGFLLDIDIDKFGLINKNYGRRFGDRILVKIPEKINKVLENNNINEEVIRVSADEFVLILKEKEENFIKKISNEIINSMKEPIAFEEKAINVTVSIGISKFSINDDSIIEDARKAMIKAKESGRNKFNIV